MGTRFRRNGRTGFNPPRVIRYADDIVILHRDEQIVRQCQEFVRSWLSERGLALKPSKTRITHTLMGVGGTPGFEFLGFAIRHYPIGKTRSAKDTRGYLLGYKTRIVPSPGAIQHHVQQLRTLMKSDRHASQEALIRLLNPGFCRKFQFSGQNPKIGYQKFNDLQTPKLSKKQICDRTGRSVHYATRGLAIALMIAIMPAGIWSGPRTPSPPTGPVVLAQTIQMQAPPKPPSGWVLIEEDVWLTFAAEPQEHFQNAHESFLKKDLQRAAEEIRKAAAFVKVEAGRATDDGKQSLLTSVRELDKLADEVERGTISSGRQKSWL
jgi:hypothetical protein